MLMPGEEVDLPVFFYLDPAINYDPAVGDIEELTLSYHFFLAHDQQIADLVQKELEKHEEEEKELARRKQRLRDKGIKIKDAPSVAMPGVNIYKKSECTPAL